MCGKLSFFYCLSRHVSLAIPASHASLSYSGNGKQTDLPTNKQNLNLIIC